MTTTAVEATATAKMIATPAVTTILAQTAIVTIAMGVMGVTGVMGAMVVMVAKRAVATKLPARKAIAPTCLRSGWKLSTVCLSPFEPDGRARCHARRVRRRS